jgi:hypothetical protein
VVSSDGRLRFATTEAFLQRLALPGFEKEGFVPDPAGAPK